MNSREFDLCSPSEIYFAFKMFAEERDRSRNFALDVMRINVVTMINSQLPAEKQIRDPRQILKFKHDEPLEENQEILEISSEEWEEMDRRLADLHLDENGIKRV